MQREYGNRLRVLATAFNGNADKLVPGFVQQFQPIFPVGYSTRPDVLAYLNHSVMNPLYVPSMVFIDKSGMIRYTHLGGDPFYQNLNKNLHDTLEELVKTPAGAKK
jgi:hypothetical protein